MAEFKAHFKSVQPDLGGSLPGRPIFGLPGKDGGYYLVAAEQVDANTIRFTFTPSQKEMPKVDPVDITLPNATGAGLTTAQINALDDMFKVCAFTKPDVSAEYNAFKTAFGIGGEDEPDVPDVPEEPDEPEKTLTSISAVYSGGSVTAGTAVSDLTDIVVTAHYSDGTSETVTGYALSGEIVEGSNTITVSYGGKTATFTVTGVAESGGGNEIALVDLEWVNGKTLYNGGWFDNANKSVSQAIDIRSVASLKIVVSKSQGGWAGAPNVAKVPDMESVAGYEIIPNNEGAGYVGGQYPYELTFDVSAANYIRFVLDTVLIGKLTAIME